MDNYRARIRDQGEPREIWDVIGEVCLEGRGYDDDHCWWPQFAIPPADLDDGRPPLDLSKLPQAPELCRGTFSAISGLAQWCALHNFDPNLPAARDYLRMVARALAEQAHGLDLALSTMETKK